MVRLVVRQAKPGDLSNMGSSTSFKIHHVLPFALVAAACVWAFAVHVGGEGMSPEVTTSVVSLSGGALFANVVSVVLLIAETVMLRR